MQIAIENIILFIFLFLSLVVVGVGARSDLKTRMVSNVVPLVLIIFFFVEKIILVGTFFYFGKFKSGTDFQTIAIQEFITPLARAVCIFLLFLLLTLTLEKLRKKEMFGGADIKILAASSLYLTLEYFAIALIIACSLIIVIAISRRSTRSLNMTVPFVLYYFVGYAFVVILQVIALLA